MSINGKRSASVRQANDSSNNPAKKKRETLPLSAKWSSTSPTISGSCTKLTETGVMVDQVAHNDEIAGDYETNCCACGKESIYKSIHVLCTECLNVCLCLDCFAMGKEIGTHERTHRYRIIDIGLISPYQETWSASEELSLIEGIRKYGLEDWEHVAAEVGSERRDALACQAHYMNVYINVPTTPLPDFSLQIDHSLHMRPPFHLISAGGNNFGIKPKVKPELAGFMPLRKDFEVEYDNEAEESVKDVVIQDDDLDIDRSLKSAIIEMYNRALDERTCMKELVVDNGFTEYEREARTTRITSTAASTTKGTPTSQRACRYQYSPLLKTDGGGKSATDKERVDLTRFARLFSDHSEFDAFVQGLERERRLKARIHRLQGYREIGLTKLSDEFKLETDFHLRKHQQQGFYNSGESDNYNPSACTSSEGENVNVFKNSSKSITMEKDLIQKKQIVNIGDAGDGDEMMNGLDNTNLSDGSELLDSGERQLCAEQNLQPRQYMAVKGTLLKMSMSTEDGSATYSALDNAQLISTSDAKKERIFAYLVDGKYIPGTPSKS
eukprot:CFRG1422T1